jgi:hypothetical protein
MAARRLLMLAMLVGSFWFSRVENTAAFDCYEDYCCDDHSVTIYPFYPNDPPPDMCEVSTSTIQGYCGDYCARCNLTYEEGAVGCNYPTYECACGFEPR